MISSINPYNGALLARYQELSEEQIGEKIRVGADRFSEWKQQDIESRCQLIRRAGEILLSDKISLSRLMSEEMGKPVTQAMAEIEKCAWLCSYYAEQAPDFLREEEVETDASASYIRYEPLGLILGVMPWNFPFWQVFRFAVPALLSGNTALLKHASNVMGCAVAIENIFTKSGFPPGVFQNLIIPGKKVEMVIKDPLVKGVSLTGSDAAGRAVASLAGKEIKPSLLELGGSNAFIVMNDAPLKKAVKTAVNARYQNTGQSCIAAKRLLLHEQIAESFLHLFIEELKALKAGDPLHPDTYIGVLAREDLAEELEDQMYRSIRAGAKLLLGGGRNGAFFEPTLLMTDHERYPVMQEETFGPLMAVYIFKDLEEAIRISNSTNYGLGVTIFTGDLTGIKDRIDQFEEGAVFVNEMVKSDPRLPFGGVKASGYGRELGLEGIRAFVNVKTVYIAD